VDTTVAYADAYPLLLRGWCAPVRTPPWFAYGPMVKVALDAATRRLEEGRELEVIDLRTCRAGPGLVYDSVKRTGRLVAVHEAPSNVGLAAEIAARVTEEWLLPRWRRRCCG